MHLYHHLLSAPPFRYARLDLEAANIPMNELKDYISVYPDGQRDLSIPCVVDDHLLEELGNPPGFRKFRDGYSWIPYRGESYRPLGSNDFPELLRLYKSLLGS